MKQKWLKLIDEFEEKYKTKPTTEQMKEEFQKFEKEQIIDLLVYLFLNIKDEIKEGEENGEG